MASRAHRSAKERDARSRAVKTVADEPLLKGSLVEMNRECGKQGCRCQQGHKHRALYLAIRDQGKRTMVYIPPALENTVQEWVKNAQKIDQLLELVSTQCYQQLLQEKDKTLGRTKRKSPRKKAKRKGKPP